MSEQDLNPRPSGGHSGGHGDRRWHGRGIWSCKIGVDREINLPMGSDSPMRRAIEEAFCKICGFYPDFIFSGWSADLTESERSIVTPAKETDHAE